MAGALTEAGTSKTIEAMGTTIHYHDVGEGSPILMFHSYGPGTTAWIHLVQGPANLVATLPLHRHGPAKLRQNRPDRL